MTNLTVFLASSTGSSTLAVSSNWCRREHQGQPWGQMFESVAAADAVVSLVNIDNTVDIWGIAISEIFSEQKKKEKVLSYVQSSWRQLASWSIGYDTSRNPAKLSEKNLREAGFPEE